MKLSQKTCLWKERIDFFGLRKDMSHAQRRYSPLFALCFVCIIQDMFRRRSGVFCFLRGAAEAFPLVCPSGAAV